MNGGGDDRAADNAIKALDAVWAGEFPQEPVPDEDHLARATTDGLAKRFALFLRDKFEAPGWRAPHKVTEPIVGMRGYKTRFVAVEQDPRRAAPTVAAIRAVARRLGADLDGVSFRSAVELVRAARRPATADPESAEARFATSIQRAGVSDLGGCAGASANSIGETSATAGATDFWSLPEVACALAEVAELGFRRAGPVAAGALHWQFLTPRSQGRGPKISVQDRAPWPTSVPVWEASLAELRAIRPPERAAIAAAALWTARGTTRNQLVEAVEAVSGDPVLNLDALLAPARVGAPLRDVRLIAQVFADRGFVPAHGAASGSSAAATELCPGPGQCARYLEDVVQRQNLELAGFRPAAASQPPRDPHAVADAVADGDGVVEHDIDPGFEDADEPAPETTPAPAPSPALASAPAPAPVPAPALALAPAAAPVAAPAGVLGKFRVSRMTPAASMRRTVRPRDLVDHAKKIGAEFARLEKTGDLARLREIEIAGEPGTSAYEALAEAIGEKAAERALRDGAGGVAPGAARQAYLAALGRGQRAEK